MDDIIYHCPMCKTKVLFDDMITPDKDRPSKALGGEKLYCPSCEMLVEPVAVFATIAVHRDEPEYRGRTRAAGSNAGGSQSGDLSDEGATQWRRDPQEAERNTWKDKD